MSIDYHIFLHSSRPVAENLQLLKSIDGVSIDSGGELHISGLNGIRVSNLDLYGRALMTDDFGIYGLDVNCRIAGTLDKDFEITEVIERLYRCFAAVVNENPNDDCSLMREAADFLAINTFKQLIISPIYLQDISFSSLFKKNFTVSEMEY